MIIQPDPNLQPQPLTVGDWWPYGWHPMWYQMAKGEKDPSTVIEANSANLIRLLPAALGFAVFFFIARALCKKYIFNSLGRSYGIKSKGKLAKFGYQFWLAAAYTASTCFGLWAFNSEPVWTWPMTHASSIALWEFEDDSYVTNDMWFYYMWGTGFYTAELFAIFVEPKRSDFVEYVLHHIVTILLLTVSAWSWNMRFGIYILFLHDFTDIFLCVAKICHYLNKEFWVNVNFVIFLISFAWLRLWCFPHLIDSTLTQAPTVRGFEIGTFFCSSLLCVLLMLHIYWFVLVVKMVFRLLMGVKGDVRSDDDDDEDEDAKKKRKAAKKSSSKK